jgi:hypothetical protein
MLNESPVVLVIDWVTFSCNAAGLLATNRHRPKVGQPPPLLENNFTPFTIAQYGYLRWAGLQGQLYDGSSLSEKQDHHRPTGDISGARLVVFHSFLCKQVHATLLYHKLTFARYCDRDGSRSMRPASGQWMLSRAYQTYQTYRIHSLDGYRCFIKSPSSRFLRLLAWMLMSYVIRSILCETLLADTISSYHSSRCRSSS